MDHSFLNGSDFVGITFWIVSIAMWAATIFLFYEGMRVSAKWRTSMVVAGLITFIAAVHYWYMRDAAMAGALDNVTAFRYVDWILTVPLMCVEFYLILKVAGATKSLLNKMILLSLVMLVTGYIGETGGDAVIWGTISGLAYFAIAYEIWLGGAAKLAKEAGGDVLHAHKILCWFVLVGWIIYPLGYLVGTADGQWYSSFANLGLDMDVLYNIADAINKIGFGLVIYSLAVKKTA